MPGPNSVLDPLRDSSPARPVVCNPAPALRYASELRRGVNEGRSEITSRRGIFGGEFSSAPFGESFHSSSLRPSLDSSHFRRPLAAPQRPPSRSFGSVPVDPVSDQFSDSFSFDSPEVSDNDDCSYSALAIAAEARSLLLKYQGDLFGNPSTGAFGVQGGQASACGGLFMDVTPSSDSGIALPQEFVSAIRSCDTPDVNRALPRSVKRAFAFSEEDDLQFFSEKVLSPDTVAFASSLRDPSINPSTTSPLHSRDFTQRDKALGSIAEASIVAARCAAYSTALADLLAQADLLEVEEDDRRTIADLLVLISARSFTEAMRTQLRVTHLRRTCALGALNLPKDFNSSAVLRVPREGPYIFGGDFLSAIDSDIDMNKRAREVARRIKPRYQPYRRLPSRGGSVTSSRAAGSFRRSRGRGFSRQSTSRGRGSAQPRAPSAAPATSVGGARNR